MGGLGGRMPPTASGDGLEVKEYDVPNRKTTPISRFLWDFLLRKSFFIYIMKLSPRKCIIKMHIDSELL
jgi:hypothetical protein